MIEVKRYMGTSDADRGGYVIILNGLRVADIEIGVDGMTCADCAALAHTVRKRAERPQAR